MDLIASPLLLIVLCDDNAAMPQKAC